MAVSLPVTQVAAVPGGRSYCTQGKDERYFATISGREIDAVMRPGSLR